ncbi:hypothetical protein ACP275_04G083200 [Erythranthe tilingii]
MGELGVEISDVDLGWKSCTVTDPAPLSEECLSAAAEAEAAAQQVVNCVHPTLDSEEKRRDVIDYVQRLIKSHINCEVFPYGSVPLKTYLPDGDIDLTAVKGLEGEEFLAHEVFALLQREEKNENAEFQVKDPQFIDAEVKLVKCLVQNIVIDISFNQLGGLSTLCFLEQVDRLVGRNHLFKRSIILVKAWCYYESRVLGAHHGLISTYALETLILYIFHLFHSSLSGPLSVLYKFLEYYSQFDWENYCVSLKGPVCKSSLPDIVVKTPESERKDLMLSEEFLENCMEMFSVSSRVVEGKPKAFQTKYLNIIDPLKENNNLGRSVHRGNFYRIRSAFKYGARKLGKVFQQPRDKIADEISEFFADTIARHGNDYRSSTQGLTLEFGDEDSSTAYSSSPVELSSEDDIILKSSVCDDNESLGLEFKHEINRHSEFATSNSSLVNGVPEYASSSNNSSWNHSHKPFYCSSKLSAENEKFCFDTWLDNREENGETNNTYQWCLDNSHAKSNFTDHIALDFKEMDLKSVGGESEAFNPLADLRGDYESHIRSLLYGQLCHGFSLSTSVAYHPPFLPSRVSNKKPLSDTLPQPMPACRVQFSQMSSTAFPIEQNVGPLANFAQRASQGTGTYFPHVNGFNRERPTQGWSRNKAPPHNHHNHFHRHKRVNGSCTYTSSSQPKNSENGVDEVVSSARRRSQESMSQSPRSVNNGDQKSRKLSRIEFGSIGNLAEEVIAASSGVIASTQCSSTKKERIAAPIVHLKNEDEFPPLRQ